MLIGKVFLGMNDVESIEQVSLLGLRWKLLHGWAEVMLKMVNGKWKMLNPARILPAIVHSGVPQAGTALRTNSQVCLCSHQSQGGKTYTQIPVPTEQRAAGTLWEWLWGCASQLRQELAAGFTLQSYSKQLNFIQNRLTHYREQENKLHRNG